MIFAGILLVTTALAVTNDWENPAVNSIGRLPPRTYSMPLADEKGAFTDEIEPRTPYRIFLNGNWKLSWAGNPDMRVRGFEEPAYDDSRWFNIDVPSCVEMRGFGVPHYVNVSYPHSNALPRILDRTSGMPDFNPVSTYRTKFAIPAEWSGRRVILRFDGVGSAYYVWVNGKKIGYAEDSRLPSEFDITTIVKPTLNTLAVEVYKWCDGSYLEDQDMFRLSGIFRDVSVWSMPKDGIWDFTVRTSVDGHLEVKIGDESKSKFKVEQRTEVSLYDAEHKKIGDLHCSPLPSTFVLDVKNVRPWSAEKPYLYTLVVRKGEDIRMRRVGFKDVRIKDHALLLNGRKIKFKGVNRHESHPANGWTVSLADMERDIRMFKQNNINTVRTAHYPNHHLWYDLCDRYGIYVCAEANVEGHEPGLGKESLGARPELFDAIVERNVRQVLFYRNHPSIFLWSMGNETGHGEGFDRAIAAVKAVDPSRPTHWNCGNKSADVDSIFYRPIDWLEKRGIAGDDRGDIGDTNHTRGKVLFMCEYAHAMGTALGNFKDYWDVFYRHDSLAGGCVWDWADQAVWKDDGRGGRFLAYGGDWDEKPNDGPFCNNGLVNPLREESPKLLEVRQVHRNLVVSRAEDGGFVLWNRFGFSFADEFEGSWELVRDGVAVDRGSFEVPHLAPLSRAKLTTLPPVEPQEGRETFLNVAFCLKRDTQWAKKGWCVARDQLRIGPSLSFALGPAAPAGSVAIQDRGDRITVENGPTHAVFNRRTGTLCRLTMNGRTILSDDSAGTTAGPCLTCMRALTDNDIWLREESGGFMDSGLSQVRNHARPIRVVKGPSPVIETEVDVTGGKSAGFVYRVKWSFGAEGSVRMDQTVIPYGTMPKALPRLGTTWHLDASLENVEWYGRGPHENYVDRNASAFVGRWKSTVTDLFVPTVRPQDNGYRSLVRSVALRDADGFGVEFRADRPLFMQALHFTAEDLFTARQISGEKRRLLPLLPRKDVVLNLDVEQLGLGNRSCGPLPLAEFVFPVRETCWSVQLKPIGGAQ